MFSPQHFVDGILLLIDKPRGWTSFDVIAKIRTPIKKYCGSNKLKVGHSGTLDPMATGLLLIATGKFTKQLQELTNLDKEYTGIIKLGATTASYDTETEEQNIKDLSAISEEEIIDTAKLFTGLIEQTPPIYSSVKVDGERSYTKARAGEEVILKPRNVHIHSFQITEIKIPFVSFVVLCSKGTYIRSLANDFGSKLACGGYLTELRRTKISSYKIEDAISIAAFLETIHT